MFGLFLAEERPTSQRDLDRHDAAMYEAIMLGMLRRGISLETEGLEPLFLCAALSAEDVATTLTAFEDSVAEAIG